MNVFAKFGPAMDILNAVSERQKLVTSNIANAHTPGYKGKHVSFSQLLYNEHSPYETRLAKKMGTSLQPLGMMDSGKEVDLKEEMIDMQKNMLFFSMSSRRVSSIFSTLRTASQIGR